jgi:hypothetical protein
MLSALRGFAQSLLGRGEATITVPSFDGVLKPNQALAAAEIVLECVAPEDLATDGKALYLADGRRLGCVASHGFTPLREFDKPITALACLPGGHLAVALDGREVRVYARPDAEAPAAIFTGQGMRSVNALAPAGAGSLYASEGSADRDCADWAWDLMERGRSGRVIRINLGSGKAHVVAQGLHYAFGVSAWGESALVSESWRHRLIAIAPDGSTRGVLTHLPIYPSRLASASCGGWWLTAFVARTQLVEFVLREPAYRKRMLAEVDPKHWIVPRLSSGASFKEPMQGAHLKTMGVVKPWAPPRSYGLVIRLDANAQPLFSLHARVDGVNHGVVSAVECAGYLYMIAKGPRRLLRLPLEKLNREYAA